MVKKSDDTDSSSGENGYSGSETQEVLDWDDIYHLIQSRYGWSDEAVVNLTRERVISIANKIQRERLEEINMMNSLTKVICSYIISTSMIVPEGKEAMMDALLRETKEGKNEIKYNKAEKMMSIFGMMGGK
jgi:predicted GTPase